MSTRLIDNLDKILPAVREKVAERLNDAAAYGVFEAQRNCPVGTADRDYNDAPHLRDTIRQIDKALPSRLQTTIVAGTPRVYWGQFVNYGTYKMAAQPFWTISMLLLKQLFPEIMLGRGRAQSSALSAFKGR